MDKDDDDKKSSFGECASDENYPVGNSNGN